jgi:hypothetical protein
MKFIHLHKHYFFYGSFAIIFVLYGVFLVKGFYGFDSIEAISLFGSRGIALYLVFWVVMYSAGFYYLSSKGQKILPWVMVALLSSSLLGVYFNQYHNIRAHTNLAYKNLPEVVFNLQKDSFILKSELQRLDKGFKSRLQQVKRGEINCYVSLYLTWEMKFEKWLQSQELHKINSNRFQLTSNDAKRFLLRKTLTWSLPKSRSELPETERLKFTPRDEVLPIQSRVDSILINGKPFPIGYNNNVMISFQFEKLNGRPIAVYY